MLTEQELAEIKKQHTGAQYEARHPAEYRMVIAVLLETVEELKARNSYLLGIEEKVEELKEQSEISQKAIDIWIENHNKNQRENKVLRKALELAVEWIYQDNKSSDTPMAQWEPEYWIEQVRKKNDDK